MHGSFQPLDSIRLFYIFFRHCILFHELNDVLSHQFTRVWQTFSVKSQVIYIWAFQITNSWFLLQLLNSSLQDRSSHGQHIEMNWHDQISPGGWLWFLIPALTYLIYEAKPLIKSQQSQIKEKKTVKVQRESTTKNLELQARQSLERKKKENE